MSSLPKEAWGINRVSISLQWFSGLSQSPSLRQENWKHYCQMHSLGNILSVWPSSIVYLARARYIRDLDNVIYNDPKLTFPCHIGSFWVWHASYISSIDCYQNIPNLQPCLFSCAVWSKKKKKKVFYLDFIYEACNQSFRAKQYLWDQSRSMACGLWELMWRRSKFSWATYYWSVNEISGFRYGFRTKKWLTEERCPLKTPLGHRCF